MSTPDQVAAKFVKLGKGLGEANRKGINYSAKLVQELAMSNLVRAVGADRALSGARSKREGKLYPIGVTAKLARSLTTPTSLVQSFPPEFATIVESGAPRHTIGLGSQGVNGFATSLATGRTHHLTKKGNLGRVAANRLFTVAGDGAIRGRTLMRFPGSGKGDKAGPRYGPFNNAGGSPPKHFFSDALKVIGPKVPEFLARETGRAVVNAGFK